MTEETETTATDMSPARAARKEAQNLTAELSSLIQGQSGLDADGKKERLQTALDTAKEVTAALERAVAASS